MAQFLTAKAKAFPCSVLGQRLSLAQPSTLLQTPQLFPRQPLITSMLITNSNFHVLWGFASNCNCSIFPLLGFFTPRWQLNNKQAIIDIYVLATLSNSAFLSIHATGKLTLEYKNKQILQIIAPNHKLDVTNSLHGFYPQHHFSPSSCMGQPIPPHLWTRDRIWWHVAPTAPWQHPNQPDFSRCR